MRFKTFCGLIRWSFEEYLRFPMIEIVIAIAIIGVLTQTTVNVYFHSNYEILPQATFLLFMFLTCSICAIFARGFARSNSKGEDKLLLSYPLKRWHLFTSKFISLFGTLIIVFFTACSMHIYLALLSPFEPMFYVGLLSLVFQVLLSAAVTITISLFTKNEAVAILSSILLLIGVESAAGFGNYLSAQGRLGYINAYFSRFVRPDKVPIYESLFNPTKTGVIVVMAIPLVISLVLLIVSYVYFTRFMEID
ncbi:MAG: ABC transporter permease [Nitrososphaerota archaeon]|jgi:ABC-type transport system involved in multi-copper enzyme maturation permease subunit|nr:ABC transporter permease [Nitrososphaerota archaeon]